MKKCNLCNQPKKLISKSHIIPDFMYRKLYDDKHKIYKLDPRQYVEGNKKYSRPSTGEYEGRILCEKCDNEIIGEYETYARLVIFGGKAPEEKYPYFENSITKDNLKFLKCFRLNYKKFKLFLLSILWRASISKRDFFKGISLNGYSEIIRNMLLTGDPKRKEDFPVLIFTYLEEKDSPSDLIAEPFTITGDNQKSFIFVIGGFIYFYHLTMESIIEPFKKFVIDPSNEGYIIKLPEGKGVQFLTNYFGIDFSKLKK